MPKPRDPEQAEKAKETCTYWGCNYVIENFTKYQKHLEEEHPQGGSAKTGG